MGEYINKNVGKNVDEDGSLKNLINKEFKRIEWKNGIGIRDDQEIRNAWWNVCNSIINEIKKDKTKVFWKRALEPLNKLIIDLKNEHNDIKWMSLFTNNADKINQIANRIDNAENETLRRLQRNRATQDSRDMVRKWNEIQKGNPMFIMEWWNDVKKQTGNIIFTEAANPVRIDQALKGLFQNPNIVYEIDYSGCDTWTPKWKAIKDKMIRLVWAQTCYLRYDENQKTYTIRDKDGNGISDRAYIWKWVKLIPAWIRKWNAYNAQKKLDNDLWKIDGSKINSYVAAMLKDMPSAKKLTEKQQEELFKKTEGRILVLLREAKKLWYDLETECVSKKWMWSWLMELHLNSGSSEVDRTIWNNNKTLWEDLYDFLDGEESEYLTYLTKRIKQKRKELDSITKTETINLTAKGNESKIENQEKQQMLYGISLMEQMIENFRESEWDSWLDNDDERLVTIKKILRNWKVSIENGGNIWKQAIINNIINPVWEEWKRVKNISKNIDNWQGITYENPAYKQQYNQLQNVFFGSRESQITAIRSLWWHNRLFDKTETSFLQQEIEWNEELTVKNTDVKKCLEKMKKCFPERYDNEGKLVLSEDEIRERDKMFNAAKKWTDNLIQLLLNSKMLPTNWKDEESEVRTCVDNLKDQLNSINEQDELFSQTPESIRKEQHKERIRLEQKENKTENDIKALQSLIYLENNPDMQNDINAKTIAETKKRLKYGNMWNITKSCLFPALAELWGWAEWKNADIYNDITGYWFWNLSDENAKERSEEIIEEIIVEVAVTAVAIALSWNGAWEAIYAGFRVAKATASWLKWMNRMRKAMSAFTKTLAKNVATQYSGKFTVRWAKVAKNIAKTTHIATPVRNWESIFRHTKNTIQFIKNEETLGSISGKLALRWTSMIIEWTTFHLNSTIIHNAIEGKSLWEWLNPFGYTEWPNGEKISNFRNYVQSIAFLWVLKTVSKPIQGLTWNMAKQILHEKYNANTLTKMFQNAMSMTWEMWSMMLTDQILSITFDQEFKAVTAEDFVSMFWMVAWLRLTNKVNLKIQEYDRKSVSIEMKQWTDIYNVKIDRDWNVIKIEGRDGDWNKIQNPQETLGIISWVEWQNLRETHDWKEVWTMNWNLRQLNNLHEGDIISVSYWENDVKFRKNKNWNREVIETWNAENEWIRIWEEYVVKKNQDWQWYHLETLTGWESKINLTWNVRLKLWGSELEIETWNRAEEIKEDNQEELEDESQEESWILENELKTLKEKRDWIKAKIKELDKEIAEIESSREISNRKTVAKDISKRRTYSDNGNKPSWNIPINEHYEWKIIDNKIQIIDKRTWKTTTIRFDAKKRINDLLGNDKELEKLDIEIAERMILGVKYGHIEVENIEEAIKIKNWYPNKNLEIVGLENGNYWVRRKTNIRDLRQKKSELDSQLRWLNSEYWKKKRELTKKSTNINETEKEEVTEGPELTTEDKTLWDEWNKLKSWEEKKKFLQEKFHMDTWYATEEYKALTSDQILFFKRLENIWIDVTVDTFDLLKLTPIEISTLKELWKIWVNISYVFSYMGPWLNEISSNGIKTLKKLKEMGVEFDEENSLRINSLAELNDVEIQFLLKVKTLWIDISKSQYIDSKEMAKISEEVLNAWGDLTEIWVEVTLNDLYSFNKVSLEKAAFIKELKRMNIKTDYEAFFRYKDNIAKIEDIQILKKFVPEGEEIDFFKAKRLLKKIEDLNSKRINVNDIISPDETGRYEEYWYSKEDIEAHKRYKKWRIVERIQQYVQDSIAKNKDIWNLEIINAIRAELVWISRWERLELLSKITEITEKFNRVRTYLDFEKSPYKTPKELLCAITGISPIHDAKMFNAIEGDIKVIQNGTWFAFFVENERTYQILRDRSLTDSWERSWGFNWWWSKVEWLDGTLTVVNWGITRDVIEATYWKDSKLFPEIVKYGSWSNWDTLLHEWQHNWNSYFMVDKGYAEIARAKDEITAYLRDWSSIERIEKRLTMKANDGGLYQYGLEWEEWEAHKTKVRELLTYAKDLIKLSETPNTWITKDKIISMLGDVPLEGRKDLHLNIMEAVRLHKEDVQLPDQIKNLKGRFIAKIKEWWENISLVKDLVNRWNSMFPAYSIEFNSKEFWRAWTADMKTVVEDLKECKTIEEVKHIIWDPKYDHINRWPNNKWWREIAAMIDDVVVWKLPKSTMPNELKWILNQFIN